MGKIDSLVHYFMRKYKTTETDQILQRAQALCAKQEKCTADMRVKLIQWGLLKGEADMVISKLVSEGFLDDVRYAGIFVREKNRFNKWGAIKIAQALRIKGIPDKVIKEALGQIEHKTEVESLFTLLSNKVRTIKAKSPYELKSKLIRFALSRGYSYQDALVAIGKITSGNDELE